MSIPDGWFVNANILWDFGSVNGGDNKTQMAGELSVGFPEIGYETVLGEGDSTTRGMLVYTFDGTTYTDITTAAASNSASTFTFPTAVDSQILVGWQLNNGSDYLRSKGLRMVIDTAQVLGGADAPVFEYWDGSGWVDFAAMSVLGGSPYQSQASAHVRANGY